MHDVRVREIPARERVRRLSGGTYIAAGEHVGRALSRGMRSRLLRAARGAVRAVRGGQVQGDAGIRGMQWGVSGKHRLGQGER